MKRTLELVSFVSFVSIVMWIVLMDVAPVKKRPVDKMADMRSSKNTFPSTKTAVYKGGLKTHQYYAQSLR